MRRQKGKNMAIVELADFKEYQKIEHNHEDFLIEALIAAAEKAAENWCRTKFDENAEEPVKLAVKMHAGFQYEHRSEPDEKGYQAMMRAFRDLLTPYSDPELEF